MNLFLPPVHQNQPDRDYHKREGTMPPLNATTREALAAKATRFREMHHGPEILVLPNAWDAASARVFEAARYPAVASTSAGIAYAFGYPDGERISREEMMEAVRRIASAV